MTQLLSQPPNIKGLGTVELVENSMFDNHLIAGLNGLLSLPQNVRHPVLNWLSNIEFSTKFFMWCVVANVRTEAFRKKKCFLSFYWSCVSASTDCYPYLPYFHIPITYQFGNISWKTTIFHPTIDLIFSQKSFQHNSSPFERHREL